MPGAGTGGVSRSTAQPCRSGWLPFSPHWHVLSLSNCQTDGGWMVPAGHWQSASRTPSLRAGEPCLPACHSSWKRPAGNHLCFTGKKDLLAWAGRLTCSRHCRPWLWLGRWSSEDDTRSLMTQWLLLPGEEPHLSLSAAYCTS